MRVQLTADLVEAFSGMYLSPRYDQSRPTPPFHRKAWELYCDPKVSQAEVIAPRDHAKSTGLTYAYGMAEILFRGSDYVIIIGSTEELAQEQLSNISEELHENDDLIRDFGPFTFETDQKTEIIVALPDGYRFRVLARGAEQKIRGRLWKGKRPNLLLCDDMEDDEQVENVLRRRKFRRWFFRAAKQAISKSGKIRVHGTILHDDSLLSRLRKNSQWKHLFYKAHKSFDDFSERLWPDRWSVAELKAKRQEFIDDNDAAGYSQEWLNEPLDLMDPYLREQDFLPMTEDDLDTDKLRCAGWDFAISQSQSANHTSCTIGGKDVNNILHIEDQRKGKWHSLQIIEEFFIVQERWNIACHFVEDGQIWKAIYPILQKEMLKKDKWLNLVPISSIKDKPTRGRILQRRHRGGGMRFNKKAGWYPTYEHELLRFTEHAQATEDDQFDSTSILCRGFENMPELDSEDFIPEEEWEMRRNDPRSAMIPGPGGY